MNSEWSKQQLRRFVEQRARVGARVGESGRVERPSDVGRRFVAHHRAVGHRLQPLGNLIDEMVAGVAERGGGHVDWSGAASERVDVGPVSSQSLEQIGFARPAAVHQAERAIELLHAPQRAMVFGRSSARFA